MGPVCLFRRAMGELVKLASLHLLRSKELTCPWYGSDSCWHVQHALSFDMPPYLLGFKGPAQCIEFEQKPMKVHLVPRSGAAPPQVSPGPAPCISAAPDNSWPGPCISAAPDKLLACPLHLCCAWLAP